MTPKCQYFSFEAKLIPRNNIIWQKIEKKLARISLCIFVRQSEQGGSDDRSYFAKTHFIDFCALN